MAKINIVVPEFAEGAKSIRLRQWHVAVGDDVTADQAVAEAATDKITVDIEAPQAGKVAALLVEEGDIVDVGQAIAELEG